MIYLNRLNLCFIRVPKTASEAVLVYLYNNCYEEGDLIHRKIISTSGDRIKFGKLKPNFTKHPHYTAKSLIDENYVNANANFLAVCRNPFEKQLSLYLYRIKKKIYQQNIPSPEHFQSLFKGGVLTDCLYHHMQPQYEYLEYDDKVIGKWWLFDNIDNHIKDFAANNNITENYKFTKINTSPGNKKRLINSFYTKNLKDEVHKAYEKDFELYERLLDEYNMRR